jgi:hypothetical protein
VIVIALSAGATRLSLSEQDVGQAAAIGQFLPGRSRTRSFAAFAAHNYSGIVLVMGGVHGA